MQNQRVLSFKAEAELFANVTDIKWFLVCRFQLYLQSIKHKMGLFFLGKPGIAWPGAWLIETHWLPVDNPPGSLNSKPPQPQFQDNRKEYTGKGQVILLQSHS